MDTPEEGTRSVADGPEEGSAVASDQTAVTHSSVTYRESIVDRTGELLESSIKAVDKYSKVNVIGVQDPRTGEIVPFVCSQHGATPVDPDAFAGYLDAPLRVRGVAEHTRLDSFIAHVNRFKSPDSAIFACDDQKSPSLVAVLDYHGDTDADPTRAPDPAFAEHRSLYAFPLSEEWQAWHKMNGKRMDMGAFAEFLEDRIVDVEALDSLDALNDATRDFVGIAGGIGRMATPTKLIELSRGLKIHESSVVTDVRNLSTGEGQIAFQSEHTDGDGRPLNIPSLFIITIPVFARSDVFYRIVARLRYRKGASVEFWYDLWRTDRVFINAFDEALDLVREETSLPVFVGADEGPQSAKSRHSGAITSGDPYDVTTRTQRPRD